MAGVFSGRTCLHCLLFAGAEHHRFVFAGCAGLFFFMEYRGTERAAGTGGKRLVS